MTFSFLFNSFEYVKMFFIFLSKLYPNLKFTYEISFSYNNGFSLITNVYIKPILSLISMQFALGFGKVAFSIELLLFVTSDLHFI